MQEKDLYSWLHISDLHVFDSSENTMLIKDFTTLAQNLHPNFLVVTGDFCHKVHKESDFTKALGYLNAIVEAFGLEKKHVYLVPGNHDVNEYNDNNRIPYISHIREDLDENPDSYTTYYDESPKDLRNGFTEYMDFVRRFYDGELDANDPRVKTPANVIHCIWEDKVDKVNLILLNTALISTQKSTLPQICDVKTFCKLETGNQLPTLVLGHHGIERMADSHKGLMEKNLTALNTRAYLCGDSHLIGKKDIPRTDGSNTYIPQYTCGKSVSQPNDTHSDVSIIYYSCRADGNAYVQIYKYMENPTENKSRSFRPDNTFGVGMVQEHFFMFDPTATPTSDPIDKREQVAEENERKEEAVTNYHSAYRNDWETVGRETEIKDITNLLSRGDMGKLIWVSGVAGIGKSDLCKAAARKMIKDYPGWDMPYISARDVRGYYPLIGALTKALGISLPEQQDLWYDSLLEELRRRKAQWKLSPLPTLYFDNFEDVKEDLDEVYGLLFAIRDLGYHLLFSSQTGAGRPEIHDFPLNPLDFEETENNDDFLQLDSGRLFCEIWGKTPEDEEEWTAFRTLIGELNGHPLAIVLAANMARNSMMGLSEVVNKWPTATQRARGSGDRHISLEKALRLAWKSFRSKEKGAAHLYWALQYYSVLPIPDALLPYLTKARPEEQMNLGIDALCRYNLLYRDGKALTMLRPIQQQLPELLKKNGRLDPKNGVLMNALCIWAKSLTALLKDTEARGTEQYSKALELVPTLMPQVLHIMEKLSQNSQHDSRLLDLASAARNYYQYYVDSVNTLLRLSGRPIANRYPRFRAFLFEYAGVLQFRLGKPEEAGRLYDAAEALYRKEKEDLGLANTLLYKGELEIRLGKPEEAGRLYDAAEKLYRKGKFDLGLANTLRHKGKLEFHLGKPEEAGRLYDAAEKLSRKVKDDLGLANTLLYKGELEFRLGKPEEAGRLYDEAEKLYRKEKDDLGLANTLLNKGELEIRLGKPEEAGRLYDAAEELYRKIKYDLGLANTLRYKGELEFCLDKPEEAGRLYDAAEKLYRKGKFDLGLANTLLGKGELEFRLGKPEEAGRLYDAAEALYRKEKSDLGLANTLLDKGELEFRLGKPEEAGRLYDAAEELYRKEKSDLSLANTLRYRGDLAVQQGQFLYARECFDKAESLYRKNPCAFLSAELLLSYSALFLRMGDTESAQEKAREALELSKRICYAYGITEAEKLLQEIEHRTST